MVNEFTGFRKWVVLLILLVLSFIVAGCGPTGNGDINGDPNGSSNGDVIGEPNGSSNGDANEVTGKNTDLPVFPGATRESFYEIGTGTYSDTYVVTADFDDVIAYYIEVFDTWEGVGHGVGLYGDEGDYAFEYLGSEDTSKNFTLVLKNEDSGEVYIMYLANFGHYK